MNIIKKDGLTYWSIEEHTKVKHMVIQDYINIWIKILGSSFDLSIIDCYGGNGVYLDCNDLVHYGSPIIIQKLIKENFSKLNRKAKLYVIEEDLATLENLKYVLETTEGANGITFINNDFNIIAKELISNIKSKAQLYFIDPFGYNIEFDILKEIMKKNHSEIILNFMYNGLNRGVNASKVKDYNDNFFGCQDWAYLSSITTNRENEIVNFYKERCKSIAKFVFPYRLSFPTINRTYYYLFHLTNHINGATIMKSSFAKFNNGKVEYLGKEQSQLTLFDFYKDEEIKEFLLSEFSNVSISYLELLESIISECKYIEPDIKKALKILENENKIAVTRITSKTNRGLSGEDLIQFIG